MMGNASVGDDDCGPSPPSGGSGCQLVSDFEPMGIEGESGKSDKDAASDDAKGANVQSDVSLCLGLPAFERYEPLILLPCTGTF